MLIRTKYKDRLFIKCIECDWEHGASDDLIPGRCSQCGSSSTILLDPRVSRLLEMKLITAKEVRERIDQNAILHGDMYIEICGCSDDTIQILKESGYMMPVITEIKFRTAYEACRKVDELNAVNYQEEVEKIHYAIEQAISEKKYASHQVINGIRT